MATANYIVTRALSRLGVKQVETPIEASELDDGVSLLNEMLTNWEPVHHLGFTKVTSSNDEVSIPSVSELAVIDALAISMAPEYNIPVPPWLAVAAEKSMDNMMIALTHIGDVDMPSTLPLGSGNHCDDTDVRFFTDKDNVNF